MMKQFLWIGIISLILFGCINNKTASTVSVIGTFPALAGENLYLEELEVRKAVIVDSCVIDADGNFSFNFQIEEAGFYILKTSSENTLILQLEKNEEVSLTSPKEYFGWNYQLEGSAGSELLRKYEKHMAYQKIRIDSLGEVYYASRGSDDYFEMKKELDSIYQTIVDDQRVYVLDYIKQHSNSLTSLVVLNRGLGKARIINEEEDYVALASLDSSLLLTYPGNKHVKDHSKRMIEIKGRIFDNYVAEEKLSPGRKAPDIVLSDTAGNPFSVKSYTGYPVLVYFWAGWNASSRSDNQQLKKQYQRFLDNEVRLLGVSLDDNENVWKGAINLDQLPWKQVSDLQGFGSTMKKSFHLPDELPYYFLLDEKLKIVYKHGSLDSVLVRMDKDFF